MLRFHRGEQDDIVKGGIKKPWLVIGWATAESHTRLLCVWRCGFDYGAGIESVCMAKEWAEMGGATVVYFLSEFARAEDGSYIPCLCREGEKGYWETDWTWGPDKVVAQEMVDERNAAMGIAPLAALRIQLGTMR